MLKKSLLSGFFFLSIVIISCSKTGIYDQDAQMVIDEEQIKHWADTSDTPLERHESGLYYQIIDEGDGPAPEPSDSLKVAYEGFLLGKPTKFSSATTDKPYQFVLSQAIQGWRIGMPMIRRNGRIRLIVPSPLGYKNYEISGVPINSVLDFTIHLREIKKND